MTTKKELIKQFQSDPERHWKVKIFDDLGFERRQCTNCGKFFWTLTEQQICNDSSCKPYEFIGNPATKKRFDYFTSWRAIEKFFVKNNHTLLKRYPVVCRWYPLYFTIAGIVDFYRIVDGKIDFEFPANPTILPQICLRFNNIPNVGITGRADTSFCMVQQTSLFDGKKGYWKDECIDLDFRLLTEAFKIKPEDIVFIEDVWLGEGAFGPSLEYHVKGAELGNAVFTEFEGTPENFVQMKERIIDMGAGLERFAWVSQGTPTLYDSVSGPVVEKLKKLASIKYDKKFFLRYSKLAGRLNFDEVSDVEQVREQVAKQLDVSKKELIEKVRPMEGLYSIIDHARTLLFAISDGAISSNVGGGYNLRVILRRALSFIDELNLQFKLIDVAEILAKFLKPMHPELVENIGNLEKIIDIEEKRYRNTKEKAKRTIESLSGRKISEEELIKLYDSEGIPPEQLGVEVPADFYVKITEKHMAEKKEEEKLDFNVSNLPDTKILYYDDIFEFGAKVLKVFNGNFVVLDQTAFYPMSGGQDSDSGYIDNLKVLNVQKIENVIVHQLLGEVKAGKTVRCQVDKERRKILTQHHDAIHIISGVVKRVVGPWCHQHGAEKTVDKARIDITHYDALTEEQVDKIEKLANRVIEKNLPIKKNLMKRGDAEQKYGFGIYAGGIIPSRELRIVNIGNKFDVEACSGTHGNSTGEVEQITILRTKRIQDGITRIEIKAGKIALEYLKEKERILDEVATKLGVSESEVPKAIENLFKTWKQKRKQLKK